MGHYNAHAAGPSSAHLAHDFGEEDDYYSANLSAAPTIDQNYNIELGDAIYDSAGGDTDYCCISILGDVDVFKLTSFFAFFKDSFHWSLPYPFQRGKTKANRTVLVD